MRRLILTLILCLGIRTFASGATYKVPADEPIARVRIPDKWKTEKHDEFVEATSPDGTVHFLVMRPEGNKISEGMGETMRYLRGKGGITVDARSLKNEPGKLNGMDIRNISWDATDQSGPVKIRFRVISFARNEHLLVACWSPPEAEKKHSAEVDKMLQSIKKL